MKFLLIAIALLGMNASPPVWPTNFTKAREEAMKQHKPILLNFSGSDWCGPCIRMHKEIFDAPEFVDFASSNLILVNADFPRLKKHALPSSLQKQNEQLADLYNKDGAFPLTLLLSPEGKVLYSWSGCPNTTALNFAKEIRTVLSNNP